MRNKNNLKRFGHLQKNSEQMRQYTHMITGEQTRGGTVGEPEHDSFDDTDRADGQKVDAEEINTPKKPAYRSALTVAQENWITTVIAIAIGFAGWVSYSIFNHYGDIRALGERTDAINKNIEKIQSDIDNLDERSLRNSIFLENNYNGGAAGS